MLFLLTSVGERPELWWQIRFQSSLEVMRDVEGAVDVAGGEQRDDLDKEFGDLPYPMHDRYAYVPGPSYCTRSGEQSLLWFFNVVTIAAHEMTSCRRSRQLSNIGLPVAGLVLWDQ